VEIAYSLLAAYLTGFSFDLMQHPGVPLQALQHLDPVVLVRGGVEVLVYF
jgi:hypothetical protein